MSVWLKASGTLLIEAGYARIKLDDDFIHYYRKLLLEYYGELPQDLQLPKHGAHITIVSHKIHGDIDTTCLDCYHGDIVEFDYSPEILKGGTKFATYYAPVECFFAEFIKRKLGIVENNFLGLHICICNNKTLIQNAQSLLN